MTKNDLSLAKYWDDDSWIVRVHTYNPHRVSYEARCVCAWIGKVYNKKRGAQVDLYLHRLVHAVRDRIHIAPNHIGIDTKFGVDNKKWVVRDPWYLIVREAVTDKINCLRGKHNVKFGSYPNCINCGKDTTS